MNEQPEAFEHLSDEELLSAFLDGELPRKWHARAAQLLEEHPEYRGLTEEWRQLRDDIKKLPQHTLGDVFPAQVLRRAEREILAKGADVAAKATIAAAAPKPEAEIHSIRHWRDSRWWRPVSYAGVAVAAVLLVMLFSPPETRLASVTTESARRPETDSLVARPAEEPQIEAFETPVELQKGRATEVKSAAPAIAPGNVADAPDALESASTFAAKEAAPTPDSSVAAKEGADTSYFARGASAKATGIIDYTDELSLVVVHVDIDEADLRDGALDQLLVRQNIAWQDGVEAYVATNGQVSDPTARSGAAPNAVGGYSLEQSIQRGASAQRDNSKAESVQRQAKIADAPADAATVGAVGEVVDVVDVVGDTAQVQAVLDEMALRPAVFRNLSIAPLPSGEEILRQEQNTRSSRAVQLQLQQQIIFQNSAQPQNAETDPVIDQPQPATPMLTNAAADGRRSLDEAEVVASEAQSAQQASQPTDYVLEQNVGVADRRRMQRFAPAANALSQMRSGVTPIPAATDPPADGAELTADAMRNAPATEGVVAKDDVQTERQQSVPADSSEPSGAPVLQAQAAPEPRPAAPETGESEPAQVVSEPRAQTAGQGTNVFSARNAALRQRALIFVNVLPATDNAATRPASDADQ